MDDDEQPLQVGDTVVYNNYAATVGVTGIIVDRLGEDYLRVKWSDLSSPTTHRSHSLKRAARERYWRH